MNTTTKTAETKAFRLAFATNLGAHPEQGGIERLADPTDEEREAFAKARGFTLKNTRTETMIRRYKRLSAALAACAKLGGRVQGYRVFDAFGRCVS